MSESAALSRLQFARCSRSASGGRRSPSTNELGLLSPATRLADGPYRMASPTGAIPSSSSIGRFGSRRRATRWALKVADGFVASPSCSNEGLTAQTPPAAVGSATCLRLPSLSLSPRYTRCLAPFSHSIFGEQPSALPVTSPVSHPASGHASTGDTSRTRGRLEGPSCWLPVSPFSFGLHCRRPRGSQLH